MFKIIESTIESILFGSRWLLAPMYLGLASSLVLLLWFFARETFHLLSSVMHLSETEVVLGILSLIDISLTANLVIIVIFSGYENFVSKMEADDDDINAPDWKKKVDFNKLKLKLVTSMVAISGIYLLRLFMDIKNYTDKEVIWL